MNNHLNIRKAGMLLAVLTLVLAACAPAAVQQPQQSYRGEQIALEIWQLMAEGHTETGSYTTNVLIDYALPSGVAWSMESFPGESYELTVTDDSTPGFEWTLTPERVTRRTV